MTGIRPAIANLARRTAFAAHPRLLPAGREELSMKTMNDLFLHFLQDIYYAEKAAAKSVSKVMKATKNPQIREMLQTAKENAHEPLERLDRVFEAVGKRPRGKTCEAMNGLLAECQEAIEEGEPGPVLDAALIACLQGIKTYEVTRYGSLLAFARQMGLDQAAAELETLRDAAHDDDEALTEIAEGHVNPEALKAGGKDEEDGDEDEEPGAAGPDGKPKTVKKTVKHAA
jgi:ferritin-like metal-binding protein YciE